MSANTDLKFSDKSFRYESADRPAPPSPRGRWLAIRARRAMNLLERQRWFLPATTLVFLIAAVQIVTSSLPAPLGAGAILGSILLVGFLLATFYTYIRALQPKHVAQPRSLLCIGAVLLIVLLLARYGLTVVTALHASFPHLSLSAMRAALPIPLGGILLTVLFNARLAFAGSLSLTILVSLMLEAPLSYFLYTFVGSAVGIFALSRQQQRSAIFRAGGAVALANTYAALALALLEGRTAGLFADILGGWICGLMAAVLTTGLLPLLEHPFERTTVFTLLELSDHNHPLLKHMLFAAPGTYHHSLMVGTLAEAAAEAVGANALLCRVGAYYHDIGKTRHPQYFVENEANAADRHTKLAPSLSRAIVMSHVKEGIEMAREYGLPEALVDMIPQHHGTRLVSFFFQRAKETADPELQAVKEEDYRYPGPRPQTREAAILMLADAVQAATRTLTDPTPARIRGAVQKLINSAFVDGQFDECDLTLRDLHLIANSFVRVLTGFFHQRIEYPGVALEEPAKKRVENGDQPPKPPTEGSRRDGVAKKGGGAVAPRPETLHSGM
jgi:putative nucleotidyltransferase with HDIG domain